MTSLDKDELESFKQSRIAQALIYKCVGFLSLVGSAYVAYTILRPSKRRKNLKTTYNRLLLALSVSDMISSFALFLSTWPIPKDPTAAGYDEFIDYTGEVTGEVSNHSSPWNILFPFASGTIASCNFQGFLVQLGQSASVLFTGSIALQYVFTVRFRWRERKMKIAEKCMFGFSIGLPLSTAIAFTAMGYMNPVSHSFCWIEASPWYCDDSEEDLAWWMDKFPEVPGELLESEWLPRLREECASYRGEHTSLIRLVGSVWIVALVAVITIVSMILLYCTVSSQEKRTARWARSNADESRPQLTKRQIIVIKKGMKFIGAYLVVWIPVTLAMNMSFKQEYHVVAIFLPMQGILNALIQSNAGSKLRMLICCKYPAGGARNNSLFGGRLRLSSFMKSTKSSQPPATSSIGVASSAAPQTTNVEDVDTLVENGPGAIKAAEEGDPGVEA